MANVTRPRSIKFSDSDLDLIRRAALMTGETSAAFIRSAAVRVANRRLEPGAPERLDPHTELLKRTIELITLVRETYLADADPDLRAGIKKKVLRALDDYVQRHELY